MTRSTPACGLQSSTMLECREAVSLRTSSLQFYRVEPAQARAHSAWPLCGCGAYVLTPPVCQDQRQCDTNEQRPKCRRALRVISPSTYPRRRLCPQAPITSSLASFAAAAASSRAAALSDSSSAIASATTPCPSRQATTSARYSRVKAISPVSSTIARTIACPALRRSGKKSRTAQRVSRVFPAADDMSQVKRLDQRRSHGQRVADAHHKVADVWTLHRYYVAPATTGT